MRSSIMALLCWILCQEAFVQAQQAVIYGTVTDGELNEPMYGVYVVVGEAGAKGTTTDIDGKYRLTVEPGTMVVVFRFLGYQTVKERVTVEENQELELNVTMYPETKELEIVTVSASKYEKKYGEESVSMEVLTPEFINNSNDVTLDESLNKVPGVNMIGETVNIRGGAGYTSSAGSRVLLLLDGIPLLTPQSSGIEFASLPLENLYQVEIIKGASSTLYGSSALNGVINFITHDATNEPYGRVNTYFGLYENPLKGEKKKYYWSDRLRKFYGGSMVYRRRFGDLDYVANGAVNRDESYLYKSEQTQLRIGQKIRYRPRKVKQLTTGLNTNFAHQFGDMFFLWAGYDTTAGGDSLAYIPNESIDSKEWQFNFDPWVTYYDNRDNKHRIQGRLYTTKSRNSNGENTNANLLYGEYNFHNHLKATEKVTMDFIIGTMASYADINSEIFGKRKSKNGALFFQLDNKFWNKLTITGGFRFELFKLDTLDLLIKPIGRGGINLQLAEATFLRASFGQGFRYPSIAERFVVVRRAGQYVVPNEDLKPEKSWSAEIGVKQGFKISKWFGYLDVSGFVTQYEDMMEFTFAPHEIKKKYFPDAPAFSFAFWSKNITDARISGLEISAIGQGNINEVKTNFLIGYTYMYPVDLNYDPDDPAYKDRSKYLNYRFKHMLKGDVEAAYKGFTLGITGYINSFMENVDPLAELDLGIPSTRPTAGIRLFRATHHEPAYFIDSRFGYDMTDGITVMLVVKNITNNQYMLRPGVVEAPRNWALQVGYEF